MTRTVAVAVLFLLLSGAWVALCLVAESKCRQASARQIQAQSKVLLTTAVSAAEAEFSLRREELLRKHHQAVAALNQAPSVDYALLETVKNDLNAGESAGRYELSYLARGSSKALTTSPIRLLGDPQLTVGEKPASNRTEVGLSFDKGGGSSVLAFALGSDRNGAVVQTLFESNLLKRMFERIATSLFNAGVASNVDVYFSFASSGQIRRLGTDAPISKEVVSQIRQALESGESLSPDGSERSMYRLDLTRDGLGQYAWSGPAVIVGVTPVLPSRTIYLLLMGPMLYLGAVLLLLVMNYRYFKRELFVPGQEFFRYLLSGRPVPEELIQGQRPGMRELFVRHNQGLEQMQRQLDKNAEAIRELEKARNVARVFTDLSNDSLLLLDEKGTVLSCNEVTARWLETTVEELMGSIVYDFFPPVAARERKAASDQAMQTGREVVLADHRNGRFFEHRIKPVDMQGEHSCVAVFSRNITAEANASAQREDIEHVMRHNLKSPLQGALSLAEVFRDADNLTSLQRRCVDMMEDMARQTLDMVNFMLDMRRMENGEYSVSPAPVDVLRVFRHCLDQQSHLAEAKGLNVLVTVDDSPLDGQVLLVLGQEGLLLMLLGNLLANALEASPDGENVRITFDSASGRMVIANLGAVPFEIRHRFFEKYVTYGKTGGTGLGTYSVKLICDALGYTVIPAFQKDSTELVVGFRLSV